MSCLDWIHVLRDILEPVSGRSRQERYGKPNLRRERERLLELYFIRQPGEAKFLQSHVGF